MEGDVVRSAQRAVIKESMAEGDTKHTTTEQVDGSTRDRGVRRSASIGRFGPRSCTSPLPRISNSDGSQEMEKRGGSRSQVFGHVAAGLGEAQLLVEGSGAGVVGEDVQTDSGQRLVLQCRRSWRGWTMRNPRYSTARCLIGADKLPVGPGIGADDLAHAGRVASIRVGNRSAFVRRGGR